MTNEKKTVAKKNSTMKALRRSKYLNFFNEETNSSHLVKVVAESEKSYKTSDNKTITKQSLEKNKSLRKNTITYRKNDEFHHIQYKICDFMKLEYETDIRAFENYFNVRETKHYFNILTSDSVLLNRASAIEILLSEEDYEKVKDAFTCIEVYHTESKYTQYMKHYDDSKKCYSIKLKSMKDIETFNNLTR